MQPTPRTSTSFARPASLTACSRLFLTAPEFEDIQPAARQQRMVNFFRAARSFPARAFKSSMIISQPLFYVFERRFRRLVRPDHAVIHHGRGNPARADAAGREQREFVVRCRLAGLDFRVALNGGEHLCGAFDITGRAQTHNTHVPARRLEGEEMIERRHAINPAGRQFELVRNEPQQLVVQIAEQFLRLVQNLNKRVVPVLMLLHVRFQNFETRVAGSTLRHAGKRPAGRRGNSSNHKLTSKNSCYKSVYLLLENWELLDIFCGAAENRWLSAFLFTSRSGAAMAPLLKCWRFRTGRRSPQRSPPSGIARGRGQLLQDRERC